MPVDFGRGGVKGGENLTPSRNFGTDLLLTIQRSLKCLVCEKERPDALQVVGFKFQGVFDSHLPPHVSRGLRTAQSVAQSV